MAEWQPIATCPTDRYVLLFTPDDPRWDGNMDVGRWFGDGPVHGGPHYETECFWSCGGPNGGLEIERHFTHWMELPDDPS